MEQILLTSAYLFASVFFILSLRGLSSAETAKTGNYYGMVGMGVAIVATVMSNEVTGYAPILGAILIAGVIGAFMAARVKMTAMPELVAILHSFVGLAAVLVGFALYLDEGAAHGSRMVMQIEIAVDVFLAAITFTGSVLAFLKLRGSVSGAPLLLPGRHLFNLVMFVSCIVLSALFVQAEGHTGLNYLIIMTVVAGVLGYHLVAAIGGADMPVVVSMLNSYSGWTAAAAGFMLGNDLLIITGALVGSSGAILSYIMCKAMNRSIVNVIFGGFGTNSGGSAASGEQIEGEITETFVEQVIDELRDAQSVIIVPGYGMAAADAQYAVASMTEILRKMGTQVRFGIHPVAGRLPGHMNVVLMQANVPYDIVFEMDELNDDFPATDVVLVIGANDIVNPSAQTDPNSPIAGMPVLEVWKADRTVVMKRSRRTGYAGVDNPLFYKDNTRLLFGDAKDSLNSIVAGLKD
jgi:NAD(P) transhydrogenase subunit beta